MTMTTSSPARVDLRRRGEASHGTRARYRQVRYRQVRYQPVQRTHERTTMTVKDLVRPLPGVRRMSLLRQRLGYRDSAQFWERNYAQGNTSGHGSYGRLAEGKAAF